ADDLVFATIRHTDRATLVYRLVTGHDGLDLLDRNVLASDLEHQLHPPHVGDVAIRVPLHEVFAVEPPLRVYGPPGLVWLVPVAAHDIAPDPRLAHLAGADIAARI